MRMTMTMKNNRIVGRFDSMRSGSAKDVVKFFVWLMFDEGVNFHPDDDFKDYVNYSTGKRSYSDKEADYLNLTMSRCFRICKKEDLDVYQLAIYVSAVYDYASHSPLRLI